MGPIWFFLWAYTSFVILPTVYSVTNSCGENMCLCDDTKHSATCMSEGKRSHLPFFPKLPSYVTDVTFKEYIRPSITRHDLTNLTFLSLKYLQLKDMHIKHMEKGLFGPFSKLTILKISNNSNLSSGTLREAFQNISTTLQELTLTSNNLTNVESDMFKHVQHTNLKKLDLSRNLLWNLNANVFKNLTLTTLDLSLSGLNNMSKICPRQHPHFLRSLRNLQLKSANISKLPRNLFICFPHLQGLNLEDNALNSFVSFCNMLHKPRTATNKLVKLSLGNTSLNGNISSNVFRCFPKLAILKLDRNELTSVPNFCNTNETDSVPEIRQLNLQYTIISDLQTDSFKCLPNLKNLDLSNNLLRDPPNFCNDADFSYTPNLSKLALRNTSILTLRGYRFSCLPNLTVLDLRDNYFRDVPSFCDFSNKSTNPLLEQVDLSNNRIQYIFPDSFRCLSSLKKLFLSSLYVYKLENNIFSPLISLEELKIVNSERLKEIGKYAFNISRLRNLTFSDNNFNFKDVTKYSPEHIFKYCSNVSILVLTGNHFPTGSVANKIFRPLDKLNQLFLTKNRMHTIYHETFTYLSSLQKLFLDQNRLTGWHGNVFNNLSKLTYLNLAFNKISVFNKTLVPTSVLNGLEYFNLAYNPFDCGCDMLWFKSWALTTNVTLLSFPRMYSCQTPASMLHKPFLSLNLTEEDCKAKNPWLIVVVSVSAGAVLLLCIVLTISVQMPTIKNYMYYFRLRKMGYVKLINEQEYTYDAYVIYCELDENWVIQTLVSVVESKGFRLCIPDREFEVGADKCDQIVAAFKESKKILVVLSNNFAKNEWCLWQMNLVEERLRQCGNSAAVFVMYKNISSKNMISSLHRTLKERNIVTWYEGGAREKLFWKVVVLALEASLGEPPISVVR